jgi:hypothetical protein
MIVMSKVNGTRKLEWKVFSIEVVGWVRNSRHKQVLGVTK